MFAKNVRDDVEGWQIFRPVKPMIDPVSGETIAYEAAYLGAARVSEPSDPVTLEILEAVEEIGVGDEVVR